jgi:hypothetical protein
MLKELGGSSNLFGIGISQVGLEILSSVTSQASFYVDSHRLVVIKVVSIHL